MRQKQGNIFVLLNPRITSSTKTRRKFGAIASQWEQKLIFAPAWRDVKIYVTTNQSSLLKVSDLWGGTECLAKGSFVLSGKISLRSQTAAWVRRTSTSVRELPGLHVILLRSRHWPVRTYCNFVNGHWPYSKCLYTSVANIYLVRHICYPSIFSEYESE
jgi:hypothetical protein